MSGLGSLGISRALIGVSALVAISATATHAWGQARGCDVVIINRGFEAPLLADNDFSYVIPGWVVIGDSGSFNPGSGTYPGGNVPGGLNVGYVSCCAGGRPNGVMSQGLSVFLAGNTTYDLSLLVGQRMETPWSPFRLELVAGSTSVINEMLTTPPAVGTFEPRSFQFVCPPGHPAIGQRLTIRMTHTGGVERQANYDEFRLIATPNCISICEQLTDTQTCRGVATTFAAVHSGIGPFSFVWKKDGVVINDGTTAHNSVIAGATTNSLSISNLRIGDNGNYVCEITNSCGTVATNAGRLLVCVADFNCDGIVDFFDYLDFTSAFSQGSLSAEFNDDGVVDFFDYLDFVDAFSQPCGL